MHDYTSIGLSSHLASDAEFESYRESHVGRGHEYDDNLAASPFDDYLSRAEAVYLGRLLGNVLPARIGRYLDFACGTGRITSQIESRADESFGVDVSASMLQAARARCRFTQFVQTDLTRDEHELAGFDVVTAFRFFGNAESALRDEALRAINRALRMGGHLILDNHRNPHSLARLAHLLTGGDLRATLGYFELRALLARNGFRIRWQRPIGVWLYRTGLFRKLRSVDPAAWPENGFGHSWLTPLAPNAIMAAVKTMIFDSMATDVGLVADLAQPRPYESDRARTAAVYGLPLQVAEPRVLEIRAPLDGEARLFRSSDIARVTTAGPLSSPSEGPFDLIVLHRTLDRLFCAQGRDRALRGSAELLRWAASMLSPAGALVGSVSNCYAGWHPGFWRRTTAECAGFAARHCEDLLTYASLRRPEVFGIHPSADAPRTILSLQTQNYRQHAMRELDRQAPAFSVAGYLLRAAWHVTGLGRHLHRDLMFWAFRA